MNPSDWRKAAALASQHKQAATTAETDQLNSMPLSKISIDDSSLCLLYYKHISLLVKIGQRLLRKQTN